MCRILAERLETAAMANMVRRAEAFISSFVVGVKIAPLVQGIMSLAMVFTVLNVGHDRGRKSRSHPVFLDKFE
jgi:hypothetical protein